MDFLLLFIIYHDTCDVAQCTCSGRLGAIQVLFTCGDSREHLEVVSRRYDPERRAQVIRYLPSPDADAVPTTWSQLEVRCRHLVLQFNKKPSYSIRH